MVTAQKHIKINASIFKQKALKRHNRNVHNILSGAVVRHHPKKMFLHASDLIVYTHTYKKTYTPEIIELYMCVCITCVFFIYSIYNKHSV